MGNISETVLLDNILEQLEREEDEINVRHENIDKLGNMQLKDGSFVADHIEFDNLVQIINELNKYHIEYIESKRKEIDKIYGKLQESKIS